MRVSFEMINVDGDMSTNDAVFALANGLAGNAPIEEGTAEFAAFAVLAAGILFGPLALYWSRKQAAVFQAP